MSQMGTYGSGIIPPPGTVLTLTGDIGGAVPPTAGNINVITGLALNNSGSTVDFTGSPGTSTLVLNVTDTDDNTLMGLGTGNILLTTGFQNTAFGSEALTQITTESNNTAIGFQALHAATASFNTAVGSGALILSTTGSENTSLGSASGVLLTTGIRNTFLGTDSGARISTGSNNINIGYNVSGIGAESAFIRIGDQAVHLKTFLAGVYGITPDVASPLNVVIDSNGQLGTGGGGGLEIQTITGNDGVAQSPVLNNFNFLTANTTVKFLGSAATETLNFGISNLILGSDEIGITTGLRNVGVGNTSLQGLTSGNDNTGIGFQALLSNTTASSNTAVGSLAANTITTGSENTAVGYGALSGGTTGAGNIGVGVNALGGVVVSPAQNNTAIGNNALLVMTTASNNIAIGDHSLSALGTGGSNIAIGVTAGSAYTTTEASNIVIGTANPGVIGDAAAFRIGNGATVGIQVQGGASNRFLFNSNVNNWFCGYGAGNFTLSGQFNTGSGFGVLQSVTSGGANVGMGYATLNAMNTGSRNTAIGYSVMFNNTGSFNVAVGSESLGGNIVGIQNTAIGTFACLNSTGNNSVGVGYRSIQTLTSGDNNTAIGTDSLRQLSTGVSNIAVGALAGNNYTGAEGSNIVIGSAGTLGESNVIRIGTQGSGTAQQNKAFMAGIYNTAVGATYQSVIVDSSGQLGTTAASSGSVSGTGTTVGAVTADIITLALGGSAASYSITASVAAFNASTPAGAGYDLFVAFRTTGAAATLIGSVDQVVNEEAALLTADAVWVASGNNAILRVTGVVGLTINWTAFANYTIAS